MTSSTQVLGISNAVVDILAHVDEELLNEIDAPKGSMTLIDQERASAIYARMGPATEMSGGSVANTIAGVANLAGRAAYIGNVADDQLGHIFIHDMKSLGVDVRLPPARDGSPTARSYVLITPDSQRTMQTYLGACVELSAESVNEDTVGRPEVILLEGYIWDPPSARDAGMKAMRLAKGIGSTVALTLSDAMLVDRHREAFRGVIAEDVKIVIANEQEIISLFEAESLEDALRQASNLDCLFAVTRSEKGSVIVRGAENVTQEAFPVERLVDTTGAGDAYSAGFLFGLVSGKSLQDCAKLGSYCASAVIQQIGARLESDALSGAPL